MRGAGSAGSQTKRGAGSAGSQTKRGAGSAGSQTKRGAGSAGSQTRWISVAFGASILASIGLVVFYFIGDDAQIEGLLLGCALGGLGLGIVGWATSLIHSPEETEEREPLGSQAERDASEDVLDDRDVTRRSMLVRLLAGAGATLGAALAIPALSLGPRPGESLFRTAWSPGVRVVDTDGNPIKPGDLPLEGVTTVFPEGQTESADSQTIIVRVDSDRLELPGDRNEWAPEGCVGYSKICTHAGCPVGLYGAEAHELLCPCHQSTFDVLTGATPTFGPAARALPQLPLALDDEGYLVAMSDYTEPVGPGFWNMTRAGGGLEEEA